MRQQSRGHEVIGMEENLFSHGWWSSFKARTQVRACMVEGSARVAQAALDAGCWNECHVLTAPHAIKQGLQAPPSQHGGPRGNHPREHASNLGESPTKRPTMLTFLATILSRCASTCSLLASRVGASARRGPSPSTTLWRRVWDGPWQVAPKPWWLRGKRRIFPLACIGAFLSLFRLTATCSQELGVSVASIATSYQWPFPSLRLPWLTASTASPGANGSGLLWPFLRFTSPRVRKMWTKQPTAPPRCGGCPSSCFSGADASI